MRKKERILYSTHRDTYTHNNRLVSINTTQYTEMHTCICTTLTAIDGSTQHTHTHTHIHTYTRMQQSISQHEYNAHGQNTRQLTSHAPHLSSSLSNPQGQAL